MKKTLFFLIILSLVLIITVNIFFHFEIDFNSTVWNKTDGVTKYWMAMNLKTTKLLTNKTRTEVMKLLGEPVYIENKYIVYKIDQPFGYKDNFNILFIDNKVSDVYLSD